ncbi:DMT family transporter [Actinosynnema sp. NPDC050801]|uniref:DMT family transporter n=1 Tax=unclassified Actinosynnema TaxID=2637065 RepID=UPI0033C17F94
MSNTLRGLVPLLGYALLIAATDVFAGNRLQQLDPVAVGALSFTAAGVWFLGLGFAREGRRAFEPLWLHGRDVLALNITTAGAWLTLLTALKFLEPAVVNVVAFAIGPVLTVLLGPVLRRGSRVLPTEVAVAVGIVVALSLLGWGSVSGRSAVGHIATGQAVVGLLLGLACGVACVGNVIYSKRLSDRGVSPLASLATRFFLMVAVSWAVLAVGPGMSVVDEAVPAAGVVAVIGVALPSYLGQVGIKHVEPITASLVDTLSPVFAFLLQLADGRLTPSALTLVCILGITALVALAVLVRSRHETRTVVEPAVPVVT